MDDYADLEAEMAQTRQAQSRVDTFNALSPAEQHQRLTAKCDPEQHRNALRTDQLHDNPMLHTWLQDLEDQCLDLLPDINRQRLRSTQ